MSGGRGNRAIAAVTSLGPGAPPVPGEDSLPTLTPGEGSDARANAAAEFVESDVVAENRALKAEIEHLRVELHGAEAGLAEGRQRYRELQERRAELAERNGELTCEVERLTAERSLAFPETRTRLVFDACVPGLGPAGERVEFRPGDPVPAHINPATLPAHAVKRVPLEG